jgi:DNA modification methylase
MNIQNIQIEQLIPYANNPRNNAAAVDKVAASIKEFGFKVPIVIDREYIIVAGHTRLLAAKKLGLSDVPCIIADDLSDAQIKAFRLADNKVSELAEWDMDKLAIEMEMIDFDMTEFGFDVIDDAGDAKEDDFDIILPEEPNSKLGDIYQLGRHRLMCGDSTDKDAVEKLMNGQKVDLFLTDPPYNVAYEGKTKDALTIQNDSMSNDSFRQFLIDAFTAADNVMKQGAVFYIWHADTEGYNFRGACFDIGWQVRQCLIWNKNSMVMGRQDYHWKHEPCLYGWKSGSSHLWASDRKQTTILNFEKPSRNAEHPTMKPIALFDYQIKNNTKAEDIVLDTFAGSGTTIMACEQNNRIAYCMELDPKYVDVIINRWEVLTGKTAERLR